MEKKLKAMKRRWRKLSKADRQYYRGQTFLVALNSLLLPFTWVAVFNFVWMGVLIMTYTNGLKNARRWKYIGYYEGRWRQIALNRVRLARAASLRLQYDRLYSDHSKLKYDYNQLKKFVNQEQIKKTNKPFNKKTK